MDPNVSSGEVNEEDEEARFKGVTLEFDGLVCPAKYVNDYTPLEFQELAATFKDNDVDGSGSIDLGELTVMLSDMDIVFSEGALLELIEEIDEDGNGTIEFSEFVALVARIKAGDKALRGFAKLVEVMNNSPMNLVQQQAQERGVDVYYEQVETRHDQISNVQYYVYECQLTGDWHEEFEGTVRCVNEMRRFQGIGRSTREAKQKAATTALKKLKAFMPGVKFPPGEIPPPWMAWLSDNFKRGAPVADILRRLKVKGFVPSKNDQLMQYAIGFSSFADFLENDPSNASLLDAEDGRVSDGLLLWAHKQIQLGMDASVLVHVLEDWGLDIQDLPSLVQAWKLNTGSPISDEIHPKFLNFWQCCVEGYQKGVELYLAAGQNVDECFNLRRNAETHTGLSFASLHGRADVCKMLIEAKASTEVVDVNGRTSLHLAASRGFVAVLEVLTADPKCDLYAADTHGNTALHLAARDNHKEAVSFLARLSTTRIFKIVYGHCKIEGKLFEDLVRETFEHFKNTRCPKHERPRFLKDWAYDATMYIYDKLLPREFQLSLKPPDKSLVEEIISKYDPDPECGRWQKVGDRHVWERNISQPEDLIVVVCKVFKDAGVNCTNRMRRTPLHMACQENLVDSHKEIIQDLVECYGVLLGLRDIGGLTAYDLCMQRRNRVGSPRGTELRESFITDKRPEHVRAIRKQQEAKRTEASRNRHTTILQNACTDARGLAVESWEILCDASPVRRTLGGCKEYVDLDTGNLFYSYDIIKHKEKKAEFNRFSSSLSSRSTKSSTKKLRQPFPPIKKKSNYSSSDEDDDDDDSVDKKESISASKKTSLNENDDSDDISGHSSSSSSVSDSDEEDEMIKVYSWEPSPKFVREDALLNGWEAMHRRSHSVRSIGPWEVLKHSATDSLFYWHPAENRFQCALPSECQWSSIDQTSKFLYKVGKRDEWDVLRSSDGAMYYRTNDEMWSTPTAKSKDEEQEVTDAQSPHQSTSRFLSSLRAKRTPTVASDLRKNVIVHYRWDQPLFAIDQSKVPGLCTIASTHSSIPQKILQGYFTCDQCHQSGSGGQRNRVRNVQSMPKYCIPCAAVCHQDHRGLRYVKKAFFVCECATCPGGCLNTDMEAREARERLLLSQQLEEDHRIDQDLEKSPLELAFVPPQTSSDVSAEGDWSICRRVPGKEPINGFIAYQDPKQPAKLSTGMTVLGPISGRYGRYEGTIIGLSEKNANQFYVEFSVKQEPSSLHVDLATNQVKLANPQSSSSFEEVPISASVAEEGTFIVKRDLVHRSELHVLSPLPEFYFCPETLESQWESPVMAEQDTKKHNNKKHHQDNKAGQPKEPDMQLVLTRFPHYSVTELEDIVPKAELRRRLGGILEYSDPQTKTIFYMLEKQWKVEHIVVKIQRVWRQRARKPLPPNWYTTAITYAKPSTYLDMEIDISGWALLQRRSELVRMVEDVDDVSWQERRETESMEAFYYDNNENRWQWEKPEAKSVAARLGNLGAADLKIGEKVLYRFEGRGAEEAAIITRISATEEIETAFEAPEYLYDVRSCADSAVIKKFVKRIFIRKFPKTVEELKFEKEEKELTQIYRQYKQAAEKRAKRRLLHENQAALVSVVNKARRKKEITNALVLTEAEIEAARKRRLAAEEAFRKIELEKRKQESIKQAILQAALKGGANLVQALAGQTGEGLGRIAQKVDEQIIVHNEVGDEIQEQTKRKAKEDKDKTQIQVDVEEEEYLANVEDMLSSPRTVRCRRVLRFLDRAVRKQSDGLDICKWGCGDWVRLGTDQERHEKTECIKRILPCNLGCEVSMSLEEWDKCLEGQEEVTFRQYHEEVLCVRRLVPCDNKCGEWVAFEKLEQHLQTACVKRQLPPLACRLGCGLVFRGLLSQRLLFEEDRLEHEQHLCPERIIRCTWEGCVAMLRADTMQQHRNFHYASAGFVVYTVAGAYTYTVPKRVNQLKIQLWGAGGGSGHMRGHTLGSGGGGAFVEALISVRSGERIEITVGGGGAAGQNGLDPDDPNLSDEFRNGDGCLGIASGGQPGGGTGYSGNLLFACGGGGGYSMIQKHGRGGLYPVLVAGGGGGGGTRNGVGGGGLYGEMAGTVVDARSGRMGNHEKGGEGGSCLEVLGSRFPSQDGSAWQGGDGCEFGAGGGGGMYGGGGGGTSPGIAGAGGGGASFVLESAVVDHVILPGEGHLPGGVDRHPPKTTGVGEWDILDDYVGQGGLGHLEDLNVGRSGAVRIIKPGYFFVKEPPDNDRRAQFADVWAPAGRNRHNKKKEMKKEIVTSSTGTPPTTTAITASEQNNA